MNKLLPPLSFEFIKGNKVVRIFQTNSIRVEGYSRKNEQAPPLRLRRVYD